MSKRVGFSPDVYDHKQEISGTKVGGNKRSVIAIWSSRESKSSNFLSSEGFLTSIGGKFTKAIRFIASGTKRSRRSSRKVSSASLGRSRSYADTIDSYRAEAIEDCIEFLNSSSSSSNAYSLQRSNSVSSSTC